MVRDKFYFGDEDDTMGTESDELEDIGMEDEDAEEEEEEDLGIEGEEEEEEI